MYFPEVSDMDDEGPIKGDDDRQIMSVLGEISNMLGTVLKRLEKTESKLESVERRLEKTSSSGSSSESVVRKRIVPQVVRVCHVHVAYI